MPERSLNPLYTAIEKLSTVRLQRLADALARDPDIELTVGSWRPQCPMMLAGFDPNHAPTYAPERLFAIAWDAFACSRPRHRRRLPWCVTHIAARGDVQLLLRCTNTVLAARERNATPDDPVRERISQLRQIDSNPSSGGRRGS